MSWLITTLGLKVNKYANFIFGEMNQYHFFRPSTRVGIDVSLLGTQILK